MSEAARGDAPLPAPKENPGKLVLRGRPRPVIRFRRGLIVGVTGAAVTALAGLAWMALQPPSFRFSGEVGAPEPAPRAAPDGIAGAPASYSDVPQLGPPLPGDLGRAIVDRQREVGGSPNDGDAAAGQAEPAGQSLEQQAEAARGSPVLVRLASAAPAAQDRPSAGVPGTVSVEETAEALPTPSAGAGPGRKIGFAGSRPGSTNPFALVSPASPWTLSAGTVIPASLITGINSDLPGIVLAQVTAQVRDSATGASVLIPQGARLIGSYDSMIAFGQTRALIVWQRIVFPDGSSVRLDNVPATDLSGYAGLEGRADFHEWRLLKGIALSTLLGVGSELSLGSGDSDLVEAIERSVQRDGTRAGDRIVSRNLDVQPTLTIQPGWRVRAVLHKDLVLKPWGT